MTLNGEMALLLRYFNEFGSYGANCVQVIDKAITMDNLRLLCLVVNGKRLQTDRATPTV